MIGVKEPFADARNVRPVAKLVPLSSSPLASRIGVARSEQCVAKMLSHTGADGFSRLTRQAAFAGEIVPGFDYLMVDDFIGQGGTLANLRGFIESQGGRVIAATALPGKPFSAILPPTREQLHLLRSKHGTELENRWQARFGHSFDCLTQSEARYLKRTADADTSRNRIVAAEQAGNSSPSTDVS